MNVVCTGNLGAVTEMLKLNEKESIRYESDSDSYVDPGCTREEPPYSALPEEQ